MKIVVKWDDSELENALKRGVKASPEALGQALTAEAQLMMRDSTQIAPWLTRTLIKSAHIEKPRVSGSRVSLKLGYGGAASKYAEVQHEKFPNKRKPGRRWHYLKDPVEARVPLMGRNISARLERLMKRGGS